MGPTLLDLLGVLHRSYAASVDIQLRGGKPVDQSAEVVSSASGGVGGNSCGDALIDAHLDAGPKEDEPLVAPHLGLALRQAQHILPPMHLQHFLLDLQQGKEEQENGGGRGRGGEEEEQGSRAGGRQGRSLVAIMAIMFTSVRNLDSLLRSGTFPHDQADR